MATLRTWALNLHAPFPSSFPLINKFTQEIWIMNLFWFKLINDNIQFVKYQCLTLVGLHRWSCISSKVIPHPYLSSTPQMTPQPPTIHHLFPKQVSLPQSRFKCLTFSSCWIIRNRLGLWTNVGCMGEDFLSRYAQRFIGNSFSWFALFAVVMILRCNYILSPIVLLVGTF